MTKVKRLVRRLLGRTCPTYTDGCHRWVFLCPSDGPYLGIGVMACACGTRSLTPEEVR